MDPTEIATRMDQLTAKNPNIMQAIELPNKTGGYQRPGMAIMAGNTAGNGTPSAALAPSAVYLVSKAMGHLGGNNITAEFKAPAAGTAERAAHDRGDRRHVAHPRPERRGRRRRHRRDHDPDQGHRGHPGHRRHRRAEQHVQAGRRRAQRRPGHERARHGLDLPGNAGTGIVPATVARTYQVVGRHDQRAELLVGQGQVLGLPARRHGLWAGSFPTTANPAGSLLRTDARHVQKGAFNQKVYRITNAANRAAGKTGVFIYCEQHAREWVGGITCLETAQRLVTNYATDPTTKSYVDNLDIFILPVVNPDGTHCVVLRQLRPSAGT